MRRVLQKTIQKHTVLVEHGAVIRTEVLIEIVIVKFVIDGEVVMGAGTWRYLEGMFKVKGLG